MQARKQVNRKHIDSVSPRPSLIVRWLVRIIKISIYVVVFSSTIVLSDRVITHIGCQTDFPDNQPPGRFIVVLKHTENNFPQKDGAYEYVFHEDIHDKLNVREDDPDRNTFSFLIDHDGSITTQGDFASFKVLEDQGARQIIEVFYQNTHHSWSRYRAYENRIEPISYRVGNMGTALPGIVPAIILCWLLGKVFKSVQKSLGIET